MQLGPVRFAVDQRNQRSLRPFDQRLILRDTAFKWVNDRAAPTIQELYATLAADERRNRIILDDVIQALEEKRSPIVLTERGTIWNSSPPSSGILRVTSSCSVGAWASCTRRRSTGLSDTPVGSRGAVD